MDGPRNFNQERKQANTSETWEIITKSSSLSFVTTSSGTTKTDKSTNVMTFEDIIIKNSEINQDINELIKE